ncbi:hypothetical protein PTTG_25823 [Puccinia triticina 1-1 BBBD Race 1]|uniref:Uncharacterized protein n=2 Tax=Puccinia triticina TaxID=208348 RepID=A0A180H0Y2_PUCT1|nr:hypothetical protein PTTG_25823 [Puccinia triticina 1-1 BBBD Race 1]
MIEVISSAREDALRPQKHPRTDSEKQLMPDIDKHGMLVSEHEKKTTTGSEDHAITGYGTDLEDHQMSINDSDSSSELNSRKKFFNGEYTDHHKDHHKELDPDPAREQATIFERLIGKLKEVENLTPATISELKENWAKTPEKVMSLYKDWMAVLSLQSRIQSGIDSKLEELIIPERVAKVWMARYVTQSRETQSKINKFVRFRLLKLGGYSPNILYRKLIKILPSHSYLPTEHRDERSQLDAEKKWTLEPSEQCWMLPWRYAFHVVDLLSEHAFIDQEKLTRFLRDEEMAKQVIFYSNVYFGQTLGLRGEKAWEHLPKSFKALDRETRSTLQQLLKEGSKKHVQKPPRAKTYAPGDQDGRRVRILAEEKMRPGYEVDWSSRKTGRFTGSRFFKATLMTDSISRLEKEFSENKI